MSREENSEKDVLRSKILKKKRDKGRSGRGLQALRKKFEASRIGRERVVGEKVFPTKLKAKIGGVSFKNRHPHADATKERRPPPKESDRKPGRPPADPVKKRRHRLILQEDSEDDDYEPRSVLPSKDTHPTTSSIVEGRDAARDNDDDTATLISKDMQSVRKSSRVPKRKIMEDYEGDIPDKEMTNSDMYEEPWIDRSLEKNDTGVEGEAGPSDKGTSVSDDEDENLDEEYGGPEVKGQKSVHKPKMQDTSALMEKGKGFPQGIQLTARQRTMQLGKDGDPEVGSNLIEFPTGLTHSSRRKRQKIPEAERLVKNAEAANRRKQLAEKTAKEIQATAIQKILGQDSSRKRKEDRQQKQREEIEQGRKAAALEPATNCVRWSIGPELTTVSWSRDIAIPTFFSTGALSYPPAREKCAAPACSNFYKYRDSKCRLPLCSLQCYGLMQSAIASGGSS